MPRRAIRPCVKCGRSCERIVRADRTWLCPGCAITAVERNAREIAGKHGPGYRRWRAGNIAYLVRLARAEELPVVKLPKNHGGTAA